MDSADGDHILYLSKLLNQDSRSDVLIVACPPSPHSVSFDHSLVQLCATFQPDCLLGSFEPDRDTSTTSSNILGLSPISSAKSIVRGWTSILKGWVQGVVNLVMRWVGKRAPSPSQFSPITSHPSSCIPDVTQILQPIGEKVVAADLKYTSKISLVSAMMDKLSFPSFKAELQSLFGEESPLGGDIIDVSSQDVADVIVKSLKSHRLCEGVVYSLQKVGPELLMSLQRARARNLIDFIVLDMSHRRIIIFLEKALREFILAELSDEGYTQLEVVDCDALLHLCADVRPHSDTDPTTRLFRSFEQPISYAFDWVGSILHLILVSSCILFCI